MMGVLWQILRGGFCHPAARYASPPGYKNPLTKFATERPIIHVCKIETSYCFCDIELLPIEKMLRLYRKQCLLQIFREMFLKCFTA